MIFRFFTLLLTATIMLMPQSTGGLEGFVRDPSAAAVPGVQLRVLQTATASQRVVSTDETGRYVVPRLPPGLYDVVASKDNFREQLRSGIFVDAGSTVRVDFHLVLGQTHDQIVVSAQPLLVDASPAGAASTVGQHQLESLPVVGRDVFELAAQQPGVLLVRNMDRNVLRGEGLKFSVHGVRPTLNGFLLDGIPFSDSVGSVSASAAQVTLGMESMSEVNVVTSPFSAEYGRSAGAIFTAVTKSGGNQFHGSAFEYFRNNAMDGRNFFDDPAKPSAPLHRSQFGGLLSGPIRRNRLFFTANYEAIREVLNNTVLSVVPTATARQGYLPQAGGSTKIVAVSEVVRRYLALYPLPNGQDFGDGTGEYSERSVRRTREDFVAGKLDLLLSPSIRLAGRYAFDDAVLRQPQPLAIWSFSTITRNQVAHLDFQQIVSPRTVHNLRAAFNRAPASEVADLLVAVPGSMSFIPGKTLGTISVTGLAEIGPTLVRQRPRKHVLNDYHTNDSFVHIRGRHAFRAGFGFDRVQFNQVSDFSAAGYYQFNSLADFLVGSARSGEAMVPGSDSHRAWRQTLLSAFFQHEAKARNDLSLSYGLRWESASTPDETHDKVASLRNYLTDSTLTVGGPVYRNPSRSRFAPRFSAAWDPDATGRMVVRVGAGVFYDLIGVRDLIIAGGRLPPFFQRATVTRPAFPNLLGALSPANALNALDTIDFNLVQPYVAQVQLSVERQLAGGLLLSARYSGTRGVHLMSFVGNVNATRPQFLPDGSVYLPPDTPRLNPAFSQIAMRRSQFDSTFHGLTLGARRDWREGLGFQVSYQWSKSIDNSSSTMTNDYAGTDSVPTVFNYRANRGLSDFDLRHVLAASFSWRIPGGGRRDGIARLWQGWELHVLTKVQTGQPFAPTVGFDRVRLQGTRVDLGQRPNLLVGDDSGIILGDPQKYFEPAVFGLPDAGYFGTLGRNTLIGPGLFVLDAGLHRVFQLGERHSLRIRLEAFNVTNHPNFSQPSNLALFDSTGARVASAGRITGTSTPARQIQLAARWAF